MKEKRMKILYISTEPLEYNSSANISNIAILKGLISLGCEISTLTTKPEVNSACLDNTLNQLIFKERFWLERGKLHSQFTSKKDVTKGNSKKSIKSIIKRIIYKSYMATFIYDPKKSAIKSLNNTTVKGEFDIIISASDPKSSHLLAKKLIELKPNIGRTWIQYWGDPFAIDIATKRVWPKFIIKLVEKRLIKDADKIIYVSPLTLEEQRKNYPKYANKMEFLPLPYIEAIEYENKGRHNGNLEMGYFGAYNSKIRDIKPLYNIIKESGVKLDICGDSDLQLESCENICIEKRIPYKEVQEKEGKVDVLVCICNKKGTQIPGKLYYYAATNKPILVLLDGESEKIKTYLSQYNRFLICENKEEDIKKMLEYIKNNRDIKYSPANEFRCDIIAKQLLK